MKLNVYTEEFIGVVVIDPDMPECELDVPDALAEAFGRNYREFWEIQQQLLDLKHAQEKDTP